MEKTKEEMNARRDAVAVTLIVGAVLILIALCGCATESKIEYYENGQIKSEFKRDGFITWSDGNNKNLPLSNISLNGVGVGK